MDDQKQKVIDSLKQANNILITVRSSPSVDQLAACIALTLIVNELGKHGTAVFSGQVPSVLEFLEPNKTLERNTDSLRDFIISLDKAKADKLRYKVEDTVVKVFITPYRTSLTPEDLQFGQGDFNVDVVVALGVHSQNDLDQAITTHGRILHDATVISLNTENGAGEDLGSINLLDTTLSSLSEMVFDIANGLGKEGIIDNQIATALLTGIVAETGRFGNAKTKPETMEIAGKLLAAGANQELVASKLSEPEQSQQQSVQSTDQVPPASTDETQAPPTSPVGNEGGGELDIQHPEEAPVFSLPMPSSDPSHDQLVQDTSDNPFSMPQQELGEPGLTPQAVEQPLPEPAAADVPPIIDLNQFQPEPAETEDQDTLDYLKQHKAEDGVHTRLEPIHTTSDLLETPKIVPETKVEAEVPGLTDDEAINTRFALTPPTMGGTLTANTPEDDSPTVDSIVNQPQSLPILTHGEPASSAPAPNFDSPAESSTSAPEVVQPTLDAAPLLVPPAPVVSTAAENPPEIKPYTTLEEIEKQVHQSEEEPAAEPQAANGPALQAVPHTLPPEGAQDMPLPSSIKLPSPQTVSTTGSTSPSPLAPPPPVPPPLPSV